VEKKNWRFLQSPHLAADLQKMASLRDARRPESLLFRLAAIGEMYFFCPLAIAARASTSDMSQFMRAPVAKCEHFGDLASVLSPW